MTTPYSTLFPTTVVGSMPRPTFERELLEPGVKEELGEEAWDARMDAAVAYMLAMMESTGVDIITDGEWRRRGYTDVMAQMVDGFGPATPQGRVPSRGRGTTSSWSRCATIAT